MTDHRQRLSDNSSIEVSSEIVWIDYLRIIAAFSVIILHISAEVMGSAPSLNSQQWWIGNIVDSSIRWCLPMFIMISGFLLLDPKKEYTLLSFYQKRIGKLLLPIIFWSLFYLLLVVIEGHIEDESVSMFSLIERVRDGVPAYHMWYMYMLPSLLLFTPYIRKIIVTMSNRHVAILCITLFLFAMTSNAVDKLYSHSLSSYSVENILFPYWFLLYLGYYVAGYLLGYSVTRIKSINLSLFFIVASIITIFGYYYFNNISEPNVGLFFYSYLSPTVVLMTLSFFLVFKRFQDRLSQNNLVRQVSSYTLGIYLIHPAFIWLFRNIGIGVADFNPILGIPLLSIMIFVICVFVILLINKIPYIRKIV